VLCRCAVTLLCLTSPLSAIVVGYDALNGGVIGNPDSSTYTVGYNQVADGVNLSGVVLITSTEGTCTGALLNDGRSILTAAHCMDDPGLTAQIDFIGPNGLVQYVVSSPSDFYVDPAYYTDGENGTLGDDLGIIRLAEQAPSFATEYSIYTGPMPTSADTPIEMAGWGESGTGLTGADYSVYPPGPPGSSPCDTSVGGCALRQGENVYTETAAQFQQGWSSNVYMGYFDNAVSPYGIPNQVDIAGGDSGGPSFYDGQIVGVHDFTVGSPESSFGTFWGDTFPGSSSSLAFIESVEAPEPSTATLLLLGAVAAWLARSPKISRA
jgi:secreted trypsin-like serine protease